MICQNRGIKPIYCFSFTANKGSKGETAQNTCRVRWAMSHVVCRRKHRSILVNGGITSVLPEGVYQKNLSLHPQSHPEPKKCQFLASETGFFRHPPAFHPPHGRKMVHNRVWFVLPYYDRVNQYQLGRGYA